MEQVTVMEKFISAPVLSKEAQSNVANDLVSQVLNGDVDPVRAFVHMKAIGEVVELFIKNPDIVSKTQEAIVQNGKSAQYAGAKVVISNATRYDYGSCGDREYADLLRMKEDVDTKIKARQMFLKSISGTIDVVVRETGEVITVNAPLPTVSSTVRVTFAKQ